MLSLPTSQNATALARRHIQGIHSMSHGNAHNIVAVRHGLCGQSVSLRAQDEGQPLFRLQRGSEMLMESSLRAMAAVRNPILRSRAIPPLGQAAASSLPAPKKVQGI